MNSFDEIYDVSRIFFTKRKEDQVQLLRFFTRM